MFEELKTAYSRVSIVPALIGFVLHFYTTTRPLSTKAVVYSEFTIVRMAASTALFCLPLAPTHTRIHAFVFSLSLLFLQHTASSVCHSASLRGCAAHSRHQACKMEGMYGKLTAPVQRAIATILLRAEVKLDTCAQLSEAGS